MAEENDKKQRIEKHEHELVITFPAVKAPGWLQGFIDFVREQGVVGLAVGLILGLAAKGVIDSLVSNIVNPVVGLLTGGVALQHKTLCIDHAGSICKTSLGYGQFFSDLLSFLIVAAAVYFVIKGLKLDKLDKKKEEKK